MWLLAGSDGLKFNFVSGGFHPCATASVNRVMSGPRRLPVLAACATLMLGLDPGFFRAVADRARKSESGEKSLDPRTCVSMLFQESPVTISLTAFIFFQDGSFTRNPFSAS